VHRALANLKAVGRKTSCAIAEHAETSQDMVEEEADHPSCRRLVSFVSKQMIVRNAEVAVLHFYSNQAVGALPEVEVDPFASTSKHKRKNE
jgi:hypothetical protein